MKKIVLVIALAFCIFFANAQSIFKKEANWIDNKDGVTYEMNIFSKSGKYDNADQALVSFKAIGNLSVLEKIELVKQGELKSNIPLKPETTELHLAPGNYVFKLYHRKLGEKNFEIELKKSQKANIQLTVK